MFGFSGKLYRKYFTSQDAASAWVIAKRAELFTHDGGA